LAAIRHPIRPAPVCTLSDSVVALRTQLAAIPSFLFTVPGELGKKFIALQSAVLRVFGVVESVEGKLSELLPVIGASSIVLTLLLAVLGTLLARLLGNRMQTPTQTEARLADELVLSKLPPLRQAAFDRGEAAPEELCLTNPNKWCSCDRMAYNVVSGRPKTTCENKKKARLPRSVWLELVLCVMIDALGDASYFRPTIGEVSDLAFAFANAFAIELFFDWKLLAGFAFWEELLPYTDFVPSATLAWVLCVTGVRAFIDPWPTYEKASDASRSTPPGDRRAYMLPDKHLQEAGAALDRALVAEMQAEAVRSAVIEAAASDNVPQ